MKIFKKLPLISTFYQQDVNIKEEISKMPLVNPFAKGTLEV